MTGRALQFALFGLLATVFGMLAGAVPAVLRLEENFGLGTLFLMRGPREAPAEVVVVGLDKFSSDAFGLPNEPAKWPRTLHAELVERLEAAGAAVVGFDVLFDDPAEPAGDARFGAGAEPGRQRGARRFPEKDGCRYEPGRADRAERRKAHSAGATDCRRCAGRRAIHLAGRAGKGQSVLDLQGQCRQPCDLPDDRFPGLDAAVSPASGLPICAGSVRRWKSRCQARRPVCSQSGRSAASCNRHAVA